jgi:hypothetical protein
MPPTSDGEDKRTVGFSNMSEIEACLRRLVNGEVKQKQCENESNCADFSDMSVLTLMEKQIMIDMEEIR